MKNQDGFVAIIVVLFLLVGLGVGGYYFANNSSLLKSRSEKVISEEEKNRIINFEINSTPSPVPPTNTPTPSSVTTNKDSDNQSEPTPTDIPSSNNFQSYGAISIENGATVNITSASKSGNTITVHIVFANSTSEAIQVYPLRTSMRSETYVYPPDPAPAPLPIQAGSQRAFDFKYYLEEDPPYRFVYSNSSGPQVDLGKWE